MELRFATKRNTNGNRQYLRIDTENHTFSTLPHIWVRYEFIEVSKREYHDLIDKLKADEFREHDTLSYSELLV